MGNLGVVGVVACSMMLAFAGCVGGDAGGSRTTQGPGGVEVPDAAGPARFDESTGAVEGIVTDEEVNPVAGAQVGLLQLPERVTVSDVTGRFVLSNVPPGQYQISANALGFNAASRGVTVNVGEVTEINLVLTSIPIVEPYYEVFPYTGFISCGVGLIRTTYPLDCSGVTGDEGTHNWQELYGSCGGGGRACEDGMPWWPTTWNATLIEATWDSQANPDWLAFDYNDRNINYFGVYYRYRGLNPVHFLVERCKSYVDTNFGRSPTPCTDEEVANSGMHIETFYVGKYQKEAHTFDSACTQNLTNPASGASVFPGYQAGCYGIGPALGVRWDSWVTVFHMELPADIATFSSLPDA